MMQPGADELGAPGTDHRLQHARHGWLAERAELRAGQHAVAQQRDQDHQAQDADEARHRGEADIGPRLGVTGVDARALDPDEHEHGDQHRAAHLVENVAGAVAPPPQKLAVNSSESNAKSHEDDEHDDRDDLGDGDDRC